MYILILVAAAGYLLGSLNSAIIVGRFYGKDVRQYGSGNAGMTNTMRTLGKKAALFVLLGDVIKGLLSYLIGYLVSGGQLGGMVAGTAAIIGHIWPVYFGFKGGKGVLTTLAVLFMFDWRAALALLGVFIIILALTRYVSLGSVIGAFLFPFAEMLLGRNMETIVFSAIIAVLIIVMHRANIKRLISGTESKFSFKRRKEAQA